MHCSPPLVKTGSNTFAPRNAATTTHDHVDPGNLIHAGKTIRHRHNSPMPRPGPGRLVGATPPAAQPMGLDRAVLSRSGCWW